MYKLDEESFEKVEKYITARGENYNQDRCIIIPICNSELTCCMDEVESEVRICQVDGKNTNRSECKIYVDKLIKLSDNVAYSVSQESKYQDYIEAIKMQTECCDKNCECCIGMLED